jgi:hypothetical protein
MFCINCGASNKDDATSCINCGDSLNEGVTEDELSRVRGFLKDMSILKKVDFLKGPFRLSSNPFFSLKIMNFLYGLSILWAGLIAFFFVIAGFNMSRWLGFFALFLGAPIIFILTVIYSKVFLEMTLVIYRMADHIAERPTDVGLANTEEHQESKDSIQWNI